MNQLPTGVYVVTASLSPFNGFRFQNRFYEAQPGVNAFTSLEELVKHPLEPVAEPFLGYEDMPVVLIPSGKLPIGEIGKTAAERFRVIFPRSVAILGENAGLDANHHEEMNTLNDERREESVLQGSFYFGALAMSGETDGALIVDGLTLGCRVQDLRTGGKDATLVVRNCVITANIAGHIIQVSDNFVGKRFTHIHDCRATDILSMNGEGSIFYIGSGDGVIEDTYIARTDKIIGMSNQACNVSTNAGHIRFTWLMVEDCTGDSCLRFNLKGNQVVTIEECRFTRPTRDFIPPVRVNIADMAWLHFCNNELMDPYGKACVLSGTGRPGVNVQENVCPNYEKLVEYTPPRRTQPDPQARFPVEDPHQALENPDFAPLDKLYEGRSCFFGDFHCHSNSGGTSDGQTPLADYVPAMDQLAMDFAAIVDHRQMRHFFLPEWDESRLICGTEPGCMLTAPERPWYSCKMDYTMIFPDKTGLAKVMEAFPQFKYTGGTEGHYVYVPHTPQQLRELGEYVYSIGGLLSHAHPKQLMVSEDPLDYWFGDHVAIETIHGSAGNYATRLNHRLWLQLLQLGKRVRTHGSSDSHGPVSNKGLTAVYAPRRFSTDIFNLVRAGDCTAGAVGIRMSIDGAPMGSVTDYAPGKVLYLQVDQFHRDHKKADTVYSLRIYTDKGLAWATELQDTMPAVALPIQPRQFYRAEIYNESDDHIVALTNPIWLEL